MAAVLPLAADQRTSPFAGSSLRLTRAVGKLLDGLVEGFADRAQGACGLRDVPPQPVHCASRTSHSGNKFFQLHLFSMHPRTSFIEGSSVESQLLIPRGELYQQPYLPQAAAFIPPPAAPPSWAVPDAAAEPCPPLTVATVGKASAADDGEGSAKRQVDIPPAPQSTVASLPSGLIASPFLTCAACSSPACCSRTEEEPIVHTHAFAWCHIKRESCVKGAVCAPGSACARRAHRFGSAAGIAACHVLGRLEQQHGAASRLPDVGCASRTGAVLPGAVPMLPLYRPPPREEGVLLYTDCSPLRAPLLSCLLCSEI